MESPGVYVNKSLDKIMNDAPTNVALTIEKQLTACIQDISAKMKVNRKETTKAVYDAIDRQIIESKRVHNCVRGCHFCCSQNVDASKEEAEVIAQYCHANGINIPKKYLRQQLNVRKLEISFSKVPTCVFLKKGECTIYEVRPIACRKYLVASDPKYCNIPAYPKKQTAAILDCNVEIIASAFMNATASPEFERLPKLLLPYSK